MDLYKSSLYFRQAQLAQNPLLAAVFCQDAKQKTMEKILMHRGYGKTYQLIKKSSITGDYIVCHSQQEAHRLQQEAQVLGFKIPLPITYFEFSEKKYYGKGINGFLIDNADLLLKSLSNVPINAITMSVWNGS